MTERQKVILYGDTVILAGLQASLSNSPNLEILSLDGSPVELAEALHQLHPAALIFDLGSVQPDFPLTILQQSTLLFIGIDPDSHQALVWAGQQIQELSMPDLVGMIQWKMSNPT